MAYRGQVMDNPVSGERFVFHQTTGDSGGELLALELVLDPHGHVPGGHVHPVQEERFEVVSGTMRFRKGLKTVVATAGDVVVVPPGTYHRFTNGPVLPEEDAEFLPRRDGTGRPRCYGADGRPRNLGERWSGATCWS